MYLRQSGTPDLTERMSKTGRVAADDKVYIKDLRSLIMSIFGKPGKHHVFLVCFLFTAFAAFGQSYLGLVTQSANLRDGPDTSYRILKTLPAGTPIFVYSAVAENGFYKVMDIDTGTDGYISRSLVELDEVIPEQKDGKGPFNRTQSVGADPQIEITNNTDRTLTLTLNSEKYTFSPRESKSITISPGRYRYIASASGVLPSIGNNNFESYSKYTWTFYIE